jgi:hypothetical protein
MTDDNTTPDPTDFAREFLEKDRVFKALSATLHQVNKDALFDALHSAGITSILVHFDGCGDSGQIEDIDVVVGDQPADFPPQSIALLRVDWGESEATQSQCSVRDAVETLAYDFLQETHAGWENNEGAYGDFTFDVAQRTITLDYNERIETSEYTQHIF